MNPEEQVVANFYKEYDIVLDTDLFGHYFIHDPLYIIESPTFPYPSQIEDWIIKNIKDLERRLS